MIGLPHAMVRLEINDPAQCIVVVDERCFDLRERLVMLLSVLGQGVVVPDLDVNIDLQAQPQCVSVVRL